MTWRKLNFQKFKEGRKERLNLGDLRSGCRTQQIRETDQWIWCPEDRHESMHHTGSACKRPGGIPGMTRGAPLRGGSESAQRQAVAQEQSWGPAHPDTKEQGSIQDLLCPTTTDFLPLLEDQITRASTTGHITMNITFLKRLLWLNTLGNTGCFYLFKHLKGRH